MRNLAGLSVNWWRSARPRTLAIVALVAVTLGAGTLYVSYRIVRKAQYEYAIWSGLRLNRTAWEAGFRERDLPVPPNGPRDGYWGQRLGAQVKHAQLGWVLPALHYPSLLEIDEFGMQHVNPSGQPFGRVLILGASTAFGGYASTIERTYFHRLAELLEAKRTPVSITVYAAGAWKSEQEVRALRLHGLAVKPDVVLFLNGLNDLTNGSNARVRYGEETVTLDASRWHPLYNEHDYDARREVYLSNMRQAHAELRRYGIPMVVVLQPALFEKATLSPIEQDVERESLRHYGDKRRLRATYETTRVALRLLALSPGAYFIDASRVFDREHHTIFTDMWHFSDPGHAILAEAMAEPLAQVVRDEHHARTTAAIGGNTR